MLKEKRAAEIEKTLAKYPTRRSAVMPLLYMAQEEYGYCSDEAIRDVAEILQLDPTEVKSVAGFYTMYHEHPVGKHVIEVCDDLPCVLRGAGEFVTMCENKLGIKSGETTPDGKITLQVVMCIAACHRAPCAQVDTNFHYDLDEAKFDALVNDLKA